MKMYRVLKEISLMLTALLLFGACAQQNIRPDEPSSSVLSSPSSISSVVTPLQQTKNEVLDEAICALRSYNPASTEVYWDRLPKGKSLAVTHELLESIATVLMQNQASSAVNVPDVWSMEDSIMISLHKQKSQNIKWICAKIGLLTDEPENLEGAGKTMVKFSSAAGDTAVFIYEDSTFWKIHDLLSSVNNLYSLSIDEKAIEIQTPVFDLAEYPVNFACLQFDDRLLLGWSFNDGGRSGSRFEMVDANTGKIVYTFSLPECPVRVEKINAEKYDYRLAFGDKIIYRNSTDASAEQAWILPETVKGKLLEGIGDEESAFDADPKIGLLTYAAPDGIWLANCDGSGEKLVLDQKELIEFLDKIGIEKELNPKIAYLHPLLMDHGKQVAATIVYWSDGNEEAASYGISIYDVESEKVTTIPDIFAWLAFPARPLDEKTAGAIGGDGMQLVNVETGTYRTVDFNFHEETTFDFQTFFYTKKDRNEQGQRKWTLLARNGNETCPLLTACCDHMRVYDATQDYVIGSYQQQSEERPHIFIIPKR